MSIHGGITPDSGNQASRIIDMSDQIVNLSSWNSIFPVITDLALRNFKPTTDIEFGMDEDDFLASKTQINKTGGYSTSATDLIVDDASLFVAKDLAFIPRTREVVQVTAVNTSTNTITVLRGVGNSGTGVVILDDDEVIVGPSAYEFGSTPSTSKTTESATVTNYCQIARAVIDMAGSFLRTDNTAGKDLKSETEKKRKEFLRDLEWAFLFGKKDKNTAAFSKHRYATKGLLDLATKINTIGGTLTEDAWDQHLINYVFDKGQTEQLLLTGSNLFRCFTKWGRAKQQIVNVNIGPLGFTATEWIAPGGERLLIKAHPLFNTSTVLSQMGIALNMNNVKGRYTERTDPSKVANLVDPNKVPLNGRIQYMKNITVDGYDGVVNQFFAELGLEYTNPSTLSVIETVTGPAT